MYLVTFGINAIPEGCIESQVDQGRFSALQNISNCIMGIEPGSGLNIAG